MGKSLLDIKFEDRSSYRKLFGLPVGRFLPWRHV